MPDTEVSVRRRREGISASPSLLPEDLTSKPKGDKEMIMKEAAAFFTGCHLMAFLYSMGLWDLGVSTIYGATINGIFAITWAYIWNQRALREKANGE